MPTAASASAARGSSSAPRSPRFAGPNATSSRTVGMNSWSSGSWNTMPTRRRISARLRLLDRQPADGDGAAAGRVDPVEGEHERRLAGAVRAEHGDPLAGLDREVDAVEGLRARRGSVNARSRTSSAGDHRLHPPRQQRRRAPRPAARAGTSPTPARVAGALRTGIVADVAARRHRQVHPLAALVGPHEQCAGRRRDRPGLADPARRRRHVTRGRCASAAARRR